MLLKEINWLHENLPYKALKLWGSSDRIKKLTWPIAFGGNSHVRYYNLLKKMEEYSKDDIYEYQSNELKKILNHAYKNVPFYKEIFLRHNIKPKDIKCIEDLEIVPIIKKKDIIKNYKRLFSKDSWYKRRAYKPTSGTSGQAIRFAVDGKTIASNWATHKFFKEKMGYNMDEDKVISAPIVNSNLHLISGDHINAGYFSPLSNQVFFTSGFIGRKAFKKYVEIIKEHNIKHFEGFPSTLYEFTKYLKKNNIDIKLKTSLVYSEMLYHQQRKFIEEKIGCEVYDSYGSAESIVLAFECDKHDGKHISPIAGISQVKDRGLKGTGELVMTTLTNKIFPLIRYDIGDIIKLEDKRCRCELSFPRILKIRGRQNELIKTIDGDIINAHQLAWLTCEIPLIKDLFIMQNKDYSLDIFIVKEKKSKKKKIINLINKKIKNMPIKTLKYNIIFKDKITRRSNKWKVVESKIKEYEIQ